MGLAVQSLPELKPPSEKLDGQRKKVKDLMAALIDARPRTCTQERANEVISEPRRGPAELFNAGGLGFGR